MSPSLISDMRSWLIECFEYDEDTILELSPTEVMRSITRYYAGGVDAFILAACDDMS